MQIELRDQRRRRVGRIEIDPAMQPTRVPVQRQSSLWERARETGHPASSATAAGESEPGPPATVTADPPRARDAFLDWEAALDDAGHLRRCIACGCNDLYKSKAFPQITSLVVVLAFAGAVIGVIGLATTPVLIAMTVVLVLDVSLLLFSKQRLVCYRCGTSYHRLPIARYHRWWDRTTAERYPLPSREDPGDERRRGEVSRPAPQVEPVKSSESTSLFAD
jgi:hypothetical protein